MGFAVSDGAEEGGDGDGDADSCDDAASVTDVCDGQFIGDLAANGSAGADSQVEEARVNRHGDCRSAWVGVSDEFGLEGDVECRRTHAPDDADRNDSCE